MLNKCLNASTPGSQNLSSGPADQQYGINTSIRNIHPLWFSFIFTHLQFTSPHQGISS
jgi:hypothetical protein